MDSSVSLCLFEEAFIPYFSEVVTEIVASQMVIWYQQEQKLKNVISDVSVKGDSDSIVLKGYVRVRKTREPFQVFSFPISIRQLP